MSSARPLEDFGFMFKTQSLFFRAMNFNNIETMVTKAGLKKSIQHKNQFMMKNNNIFDQDIVFQKARIRGNQTKTFTSL